MFSGRHLHLDSITNRKNTPIDNKVYFVGSGVGRTSRSVRAALVRKTNQGPACKLCKEDSQVVTPVVQLLQIQLE